MTLLIESNEGRVEQKLTRGILQGSVISPVLFNIYTDDIHQFHSPDIKIIQFRDDFAITFEYRKPEYEDNIVETYKEIQESFRELGLKINTNKTKYQLFGVRNSNFRKLEEEGLEKLCNYKYLGIIVDTNLILRCK